MVLVFVCHCFGMLLVRFWYAAGTVLVLICYCFGIALVWFWYSFGIALVLLYHDFGTVLVGIVLVWFLSRFCFDFPTFLSHEFRRGSGKIKKASERADGKGFHRL